MNQAEINKLVRQLNTRANAIGFLTKEDIDYLELELSWPVNKNPVEWRNIIEALYNE